MVEILGQKNNSSLYIFGAGGGAVEALEDSRWVVGESFLKPKHIFLVEDEPEKKKVEFLGVDYPVIAQSELPAGEIYGHISAFTPKYKEKVDKLENVKWVTALSYMARLPNYLAIGFNLRAYAFVGRTALIGRHVKMNFHAVVPHYCEIGDYSFISHNVAMGGNVVVGKKSCIYENSTIIPGIKIGENTVIGAGSVVTKDIPSNVVAFGNPCKVVRDND